MNQQKLKTLIAEAQRAFRAAEKEAIRARNFVRRLRELRETGGKQGKKS